LIERPYFSYHRDHTGLYESRSLGKFSWTQGEKSYVIHIEQLRQQLFPILDQDKFKTPLSDHTFIRVNHLIDRVINFHEVAIDLISGEIVTPNFF